jgi:hypothetical protein
LFRNRGLCRAGDEMRRRVDRFDLSADLRYQPVPLFRKKQNLMLMIRR